MANLTESIKWWTNVFRLELTTPAKGGAPAFDVSDNPTDGFDNAQAQQLADRTTYLKDKLDNHTMDDTQVPAADAGSIHTQLSQLANRLKILVGTTGWKDGAVTADQTVVPTNSQGTVKALFSGIMNRITAITGTTNWYDTPATTLNAAKAHADTQTTVHGSTSVATASKLIHRDANGRAQVADPSAAADIATKGYVDGKSPLGEGQTWQDVLVSRAAETAYQNSAGRSIEVALSVQSTGANGSGGNLEVSADNVTWKIVGMTRNIGGGAGFGQLSCVVPSGYYYKYVNSGGSSINTWMELR